MTAVPPASGIYSGVVAHRRLRPRSHAFRYRAYWLLLDLDEVPFLARRLRLFSHNRWNLLSFHDVDHAGGSGQPLRVEMQAQLDAAGIDMRDGTIRVLCMPRVLGFVFNPLSIHFCYGRDGALKALVYEVHNTFRQRHSYLIGVPAAPLTGDPVRQDCAKRFYVSPFMAMEQTYSFRVHPPADRIGVTISGADAEGPIIVASLSAERRELTDAALLRQFFLIPLVTAKVVAAIHWEALRLWLKGLPLVPRPPPPAEPVSALAPQEVAVAE